MAQHDFNIANQGFPATRADINNALQALASNSSGTSAPSTMFANQWWYDTTNNKLYIRNEANNAWIQVAVLDQTNNEWQITTGQISASDGDGLVFKTDDGNTRITLSDGGDVTFADGTDIITATAGTDNVRIGAGAGDSIASGGNNNTVIGKDAGTAISTGDANVAMGKDALLSNTTAGNNVAVGASALRTNTTGAQNTAVGHNALFTNNSGEAVAVGYEAAYSNTSGVNLTAIGKQALYANTSGHHNTAVGIACLDANTTGQHNTAVGVGSLGANTTASNNTSIGSACLSANTTGDAIVGVGKSTLQANTTGRFNTGCGYEALYSNTTASSNTALGQFALGAATTGGTNIGVGTGSGSGITTGNGNICVGVEAGQNNIPVTTGVDNIFIGYQARANASNATRQYVLGKQVTCSGDDNFTFGHGATDSNIAFGATSITAPSDERYKEEITTSTAGLAFINDLRPVTFKWKKEKDVPSDHDAYVEGSDTRVMLSTGETNHGFIAQEVKTAIDAHSEIKDGFRMWAEDQRYDADGNLIADGRQRVAPSELVPMLTKAIQELSAKNDALEARIATLEG